MMKGKILAENGFQVARDNEPGAGGCTRDIMDASSVDTAMRIDRLYWDARLIV